ncbi:acyltransferase [Tetragenococcus muriaticus]|uniref:Maltose O-acetyltransferase n=2 Tax=Tetragenococcus muriaticus TaxID=64642 RepID=A0A091C185_9ENTE|nr:DapH/DapD/GlmU-related protein [Tetragenococcus muriaticus]KFN89309.1 maltose O-acetyltransferase [Tetragenococcus muriaticus PMC-11-5]KFN91621.1 maltose O-acetyltransferase [Tetragenococcus muriaticus 3MR10-3]GMA46609.1 acetyltransferase [Tetragenococcus muriaticus]
MELQGLLREIAEKGVLYPNTEAIQMMDKVSNEARELCTKLNTGVYTDEEIRQQMSQITGKELDENFALFLPFTTDFGKNINIGKNVFINSGCRFQDQGGIVLEDQSLLGHNVVLATINHDYDPDNRGTLHLAPVVLKEKTWIGSNVTILPGVTVGENSVVAAGSVVTKDVAPNTVVGGNPAKFISHLEDKLK